MGVERELIYCSKSFSSIRQHYKLLHRHRKILQCMRLLSLPPPQNPPLAQPTPLQTQPQIVELEHLLPAAPACPCGQRTPPPVAPVLPLEIEQQERGQQIDVGDEMVVCCKKKTFGKVWI
ncbi:hypothetical protein CCACVL1_26758 [Corchorus capsularis]|uniref:Uncharacterized protein n=1 Tax=Corchorus capsularis TaxID=210143 RepID=A0A1R3GDI5_COCAP|nr:hypothetical protein CCACVL1_26758 [Corchorus capsularis]